MIGLADILSNLTNVTSEIISSYKEITLDRNLGVLSPIDEINRNLSAFRNLLCVAHLNAVSIPKHKDEIFRILCKTNIDILCISETNIKKNTPKNLYNFPGYKFFHINRDWGKCGGVGILIKNEYALKAKKINVNFKQTQPENIFIELEVNKLKVVVGVLYKSPKVRYGVFNDIFETLAFLTTKYSHCLFLGDFNIDQLQTGTAAYKFFQNNIIDPLSLTQLVKSPTRIRDNSCTLIDLILANSPKNVKFVGTAEFPGVSDHKLVYCSYALKKDKFKPQIIKRRDFRNFVSDNFVRQMRNADWDNIHMALNNNLDDATMKLEDTYINIINKNAPMRDIKVSKPAPASWLTDEITFLMDLRDKYKNKWNEIKKNSFLNGTAITVNDNLYFKRFKELKNQVNHSIRKAKYADFNSKINSKLCESKKFHFNLKQFNVVDSKKK